MWRVDSIEINGGYTPTGGGPGGIFGTHETAFLDSIKLELIPEPVTLVLLDLRFLPVQQLPLVFHLQVQPSLLVKVS